MSSPPHKRKAPLLKTFWRRLCLGLGGYGLDYITANEMQILIKFAENQNQTYCSVLKTLLPKEHEASQSRRPTRRWTISFINANW